MHSSDPAFRVLHLLRLRGVCPKETLIAVTGLQADEVEPILWPLEDAGLVTQRTGGGTTGWTLTREGRGRHAELLAADRAAGDLPDVLDPPYTRFVEVDRAFTDLCSDRRIGADDGGPEDDATLERLRRIHEVAGPAAEQAGAAVERFASYAPRLAYAFGRVRDGDPGWLVSPTIDSYHTVWFELHEDLLLSRGVHAGPHF